MIKEFIGTGKTIEQATLAAKAGLNAPSTADVKIEVLAMPAKKFLGLFGGSDAQIKASYDDGKKEKKQNAKKQNSNRTEAFRKKGPPPAPAHKKETDKQQAGAPEPKLTEKDVDFDYVRNYLSTMIQGMDIADVEIKASVQDGVVVMDIDCDDYGIIIGRRGETLDALQYLTSLAIKKSCDQYVRVTLNVGNYREKRAETLRNLARKNALYVARSGRRYTFEPMNPYERRIIHTTIQEIEGVESKSVGYNQDRRVMLEPVGGVKFTPSYSGKKDYSKSSSRPVNTAPPKADRADLPKFGKIEVNKD